VPIWKNFGEESFKDKIMNPGPWEFFITGFAESLPNHEIKSLSQIMKCFDKWGQPNLVYLMPEWGSK